MSTTMLLKHFSTQPLLLCAAKPLTLCLRQQSRVVGPLSYKLAGLVSIVIGSDKVIEPVRAQQ